MKYIQSPIVHTNATFNDQTGSYTYEDPSFAPDDGSRFQLWTNKEGSSTRQEVRDSLGCVDLVVSTRVKRDGNERALTRWLATGSREDMERAFAAIQRDGWDSADTHWSADLDEWTRPELPLVPICDHD